jgi:hypothetical protein
MEKSMRKVCLMLVLSLSVLFSQSVQAESKDVIWERDGDVDALLADASSASGKPLPVTGSALPIANVVNPINSSLSSLPANSGNNWLQKTKAIEKNDHEAEIFSFKGKVRVKKKGSDYWTPVYKRMRLQVGDEILTYKKSSLAAKYDTQYKDLIYVDEKTHAILESIEPTKILLEEGKMFHYLDAVVKNRNYQIVNRSTTLGIRGTHALTSFNPRTGESFFGNFPTDDGHDSLVEVCLTSGGSEAECLNLKEGQGGAFDDSEEFDDDNVDPLTQEQIDENEQKLKEMEDSDPNFGLRNSTGENGGTLPPTGGGFSSPGVIDPAGSGNVGGGGDTLDPLLDTDLDLLKNLEPLFEDDIHNRGGDDPACPNNDCGDDGHYE